MPEYSLQTIILAGGFGTRLSPLTEGKPKPLIKILDKSVLELVINGVRKTKENSIVVSTHYKHDMIERLCKELDESILCKNEVIPLGTAGGVKNCYDGKSDYVLVVSGDAVFDFNLQKMIDFHVKNKSDVTIMTSRKENPTELGNVMCDEENNIACFLEKPSWKNVKTDLVNTGIYVISKCVLSEIPDNISYDFSKNLFPKLLAEGRKIMSFEEAGFWCDIGTLDEYYNCNMSAANEKIGCITNTGEKEETLLYKSIHAFGINYVSPAAEVGKNVKLSSSVICKNTNICNDCDIVESVIGEGSFVGKGSSVCCAIVGENVSIGENCIIPEGCVIGDMARICDGTRLKKHTHVKTAAAISKEDKQTMDFSKNMTLFKDDAMAVFDCHDAGLCLSNLGKALVIAEKKRQNHMPSVAVMCDEKSGYAKYSFVSGLQSAGAEIYELGMGEMSMLKHAAGIFKNNLSVYLYTSNDAVNAVIYDKKANLIDQNHERKIAKVYSMLFDGESDAYLPNINSKIVTAPVKDVYETHLVNLAYFLQNDVDLYTMQICTQNPTLCSVFTRLGAQLSPSSTAQTLNVNVENNRAKARKTTLVLDHDHLCAIVLKNLEYISNPKIVLPEDTPTTLKNLMPKQQTDSHELLDLSDPYTLIVALAVIMNVTAKTLEELASEIPTFEVYNDEYIADVNRASTMEKLSKLYSDTKNTDTAGIRLQMADGNVTVVPNRAKGFKIMAEAANMETAKELSFKIGEIIKNS